MKKSILICMIILSSVVLFGCQHDKIQFNRESAASSLFKQGQKQKPKYKSSSGIIILGDDNVDSPAPSMRFGPRDINFDMPVKF